MPRFRARHGSHCRYRSDACQGGRRSRQPAKASSACRAARVLLCVGVGDQQRGGPGSVRTRGIRVRVHSRRRLRGRVPHQRDVPKKHRCRFGHRRPPSDSMSVEVTRGWTDRLETNVFIQTAPFGSTGSARFAGGHLRSKVRFGLLLVANPSLELVTRGSEGEGLNPVFDVSVRGAWQPVERVALTSDYFSAAATTRHLQPEPSAHHLIFAGLDLDIAAGWELGISAGHCVTRGEPGACRRLSR
jgi:hypothetical protein